MNLENQNIAQVNQELTTIRDYIRWGYSLFNGGNLYYGHGFDNGWDEAVHLVLSGLHLPPDVSQDVMNAILTTVERRHVSDLILRRVKERIPVAYLTHEAWFASLPFYVDERVIIPRSPMAELIENGFTPWLDTQEVSRILDLCTGSGCIAIASAMVFPESEVTAVDLSKDALDVAQINVKKHRVADQVELLQSNLFEKVTGKYDLILSNPPYVSDQEYQALPKEYSHEPEMALKASESGLQIVKQILKQAGNFLLPDGLLIVEVGNSQEALVEEYPEVPFVWIDFERGGDGIFLLTAKELQQYQSIFNEQA
jgi:ribosomal protein L3 glutamine methyltransferase